MDRYRFSHAVSHMFPLALCLSLAFAPAVRGGDDQPAQEQEQVRESAEPAPAKQAAPPQAQPADDTFLIRSFVITGNTIFPEPSLVSVLDDLTGEGKTATDVEAARDRLERYYHENGYPAVLVNIPEQSTEGGSILLQVIEGKVGKVTVTGNRWFSTAMILDRLPSFTQGEQVYVPRISKEIGRANSNPDRKVTPGMAPGKEPGTVDFDLKVEDSLPLHGSVEINNRRSLNTSDLRLSAALRYDNLWQEEHSLSLQYQTSPKKPSEVQVVSASYTLPLPYDSTHKLVLYGVMSDSETAALDGLKTVGKGSIAGLRYIRPLQSRGSYSHNLSAGIDYKDFEETTGFKTRIKYLPLSFAYNSAVMDSTGTTSFSAGLNVAFRGMVSDAEYFGAKRANARDNYIFFTAGVERLQQLSKNFNLLLKVDGQASDQPLISNEQYSAGGMESVRGYYESEATGDDAIHSSFELSMNNVLPDSYAGYFQAAPYVFFDYAHLWTKEALPGQAVSFDLQGTGGGIRGRMLQHLEYQLEGAVALRDKTGSPDNTRKGDARALFKVKYAF